MSRRDVTGSSESEPEAAVSRRRFLTAGGAGLGATSAVWSFLVPGRGEATDSRRRNDSKTAVWRGSRDTSDLGEASHPRAIDEATDGGPGTDDRTATDGETAGAADTESATTDQSGEPATDTETATATSRGVTRDRRLLGEGTVYETPLYVVDARRDGPTAFLVGGMHGDERAGHRAADRIATWRIERGTMVVLPAANRIALDRDTRKGRHGDLNRQFPATDARAPRTPLAKAIWKTVVEYDPDWLADMHASVGIFGSGDGGVGQAIFPSSVAPAGRYAADTVEAVNAAFGFSGSLAYRRGNVLNGDRPMLAHRAAELLDVPTFILETTRRIDLDRQTDHHLYCIDHLLHLFDQGPFTPSEA